MPRFFFFFVSASRKDNGAWDWRINNCRNVAFRSAKECGFRGAKGDIATVIDSSVLKIAQGQPGWAKEALLSFARLMQ
jgi:hypothetical protein